MYKKWIKSNILDIIQVVAIVGAGVTGIIVWLQNVPWYLVVLGVLFAIVLVITGVNQYDNWKERHRKKLTQLSDKEIEDTIRNWLDYPAFKVQRQIDGECLFRFEVTDTDQRIIAIRRPKARPMQIELGATVMLGKAHKLKYESLKPNDKTDMVHELRIEMARLGVGFQGINTPLTFINISDIILLDDTLGEFYIDQRIMFIRRAVCLIDELISKQLDNISELNSHKEGSQT